MPLIDFPKDDPQALEALKAKYGDNVNPDDFVADTDSKKIIHKMGWIRSGLTSAAANVIPGVASGVGASLGGGAGLLMGLPEGPLAVIPAVGGAIVGGGAAGYAANRLQEDMLPDSMLKQIALARASHPTVANLSGLATQVLSSGGSLVPKGVGALIKGETGEALKQFLISKAPQLMGVNAAVEAGREGVFEDKLSPKEIALAALSGAGGHNGPYAGNIENLSRAVATKIGKPGLVPRVPIAGAAQEPSTPQEASVVEQNSLKKLAADPVQFYQHLAQNLKSLNGQERIDFLTKAKEAFPNLDIENYLRPVDKISPETMGKLATSTPEALAQLPDYKWLAEMKKAGIVVKPEDMPNLIYGGDAARKAFVAANTAARLDTAAKNVQTQPLNPNSVQTLTSVPTDVLAEMAKGGDPTTKAVFKLRQKGISVTPEQVQQLHEDPSAAEDILADNLAQTVGQAAKVAGLKNPGIPEQARLENNPYLKTQMRKLNNAKSTIAELTAAIKKLPEGDPQRGDLLAAIQATKSELKQAGADIGKWAEDKGILSKNREEFVEEDAGGEEGDESEPGTGTQPQATKEGKPAPTQAELIVKAEKDFTNLKGKVEKKRAELAKMNPASPTLAAHQEVLANLEQQLKVAEAGLQAEIAKGAKPAPTQPTPAQAAPTQPPVAPEPTPAPQQVQTVAPPVAEPQQAPVSEPPTAAVAPPVEGAASLPQATEAGVAPTSGAENTSKPRRVQVSIQKVLPKLIGEGEASAPSIISDRRLLGAPQPVNEVPVVGVAKGPEPAPQETNKTPSKPNKGLLAGFSAEEQRLINQNFPEAFHLSLIAAAKKKNIAVFDPANPKKVKSSNVLLEELANRNALPPKTSKLLTLYRKHAASAEVLNDLAFDKKPAKEKSSLENAFYALEDKIYEEEKKLNSATKASKNAPAPVAEPPIPGAAQPPSTPIGMRVNRKAAQAKKAEGGFVLNPFRSIDETGTKLVVSVGQRIKDLNSYIGNKVLQWPILAQQMENAYLRAAKTKVFDGLSPKQLEELHHVIYAQKDSGQDLKPFVQDPVVRSRVQEFENLIRGQGVHQQAEGPYIGGKRALAIQDFYAPEVVKQRIKDILKGPDNAEKTRLTGEFVSHYMASHPGATPEEAISAMSTTIGATPHSNQVPTVEFGPTRREAGESLPPSWRSNIAEAYATYNGRWAKDMAYHKLIESDPNVAIPLGIKEDGRGQVHPSTPSANRLPLAQNPELAPLFRNALSSYMNHNPGNKSGELAYAIVRSGILGPLSWAKDIVSTPASMYALFDKPGSLPNIVEGLYNTLTDVRGSMAKAEKAGSYRLRNPAQPDALDNLSNKTRQLLHMADTYTGNDFLARLQRTWAHNVGELTSQQMLERARAGDAKAIEFMNDHAPADWRTMPDEAIHANVGARFARHTGAYDFTDLPAWALPHEGNPIASGPLRMARWSLGQANHFNNYVMRPLKQGNVVPLLVAAGVGGITKEVADKVARELFAGKPKTMTMEEYLGLDHPDKEKFLYTRLASVMPAGIMSDLATGVAQKMFLNTDTSQINSGPLMDYAMTTAGTLGNFLSAVKNNPSRFVELLPSLAKEIVNHNLQFARIISRTVADEENFAHERRMFAQLMGDKVDETYARNADPFSPESRFARAKTLEEAQAEVPFLKRAPILHNPSSDENFYKFLAQIKGPEAAQKAWQQDQTSRELNEKKKELIANLPTAKEYKEAQDEEMARALGRK